MGNIVISYRRADTQALAGRIRDRLVARFGASVVFMDIDSIGYGADFASEIRRALQGADTLVPVIGPAWAGPRPGGKARIHDADDPVRIEVETALELGLRIVPVLVEGTPMPEAGDLPPSLARLATRNAVTIDPGRDFDVHTGRLIAALAGTPRGRRRWGVYGTAAALALAIGGAAAWWLSRDAEPVSLALSEAECTGLRGIAAEAPQRFMGLRWPTPGQDFWEVPVRIDGFDTCFVGTGIGPAVNCERALVAGERRAELLDSYASSAAACLGKDWIARHQPDGSRSVEGKVARLLITLTNSTEPARLMPDGGKANAKLGVLVRSHWPEPDRQLVCQQAEVFLTSALSGFKALKGMPDAEGGFGIVITPAQFDSCRLVPADGKLEMVCRVGTAVPESNLAMWMDAHAQFLFACLGQSFKVEGVDARSRVIRSDTPGVGEIRMTIAPQTPPPDRPLMTGDLQVIFAPP